LQFGRGDLIRSGRRAGRRILQGGQHRHCGCSPPGRGFGRGLELVDRLDALDQQRFGLGRSALGGEGLADQALELCGDGRRSRPFTPQRVACEFLGVGIQLRREQIFGHPIQQPDDLWAL
jgi:hypothetical protein